MNAHKHSDISKYLLTQIAAGKYGAADRLPSEAQLSTQFKVSRPTVARAFRDLMAEGIIERRAGAGTFVRDKKRVAVATRQIGLLIPGLGTTEIFEIICGELASLGRRSEYTLLWGGSSHPRLDQDGSREHARELCEQFIERRVAGVFFAPFELTEGQDEVNRSISEQFSEAGIALVLLDRDLAAFPRSGRFDVVGLDNVAAGYLLAEHLIKLGCKDIAFVMRPLSAPTVERRFAGVREALARNKIEVQPDWLQTGDPQDSKFVCSLMAGKRWDAIICANDLTAAQLIRTIEHNRWRVPEDVRVAGFDDAKYATLVSVPLTTIRQPCKDIAVTAFQTMLSRIAEPTLPPRNVLLAPQLVIRESCGAYLSRKNSPVRR
ncbi:MAG TPA: GntR family transcriptional regulator [Verrucomicrobiae bacterium]|jgi:LacI family transcriptional regulator|nr:GntR family transcriptional regulator [Verrucomicrobiae bacterium]